MGKIFIGIVLILLFVFGFSALNSQKQITSLPIKPTVAIIDVTPTKTISVTQGTVPLPQDIDIIRSFFGLINEKKVSEAVMMMSDSIIRDDTAKQAWGVQLNAMKSLKFLSIEPSMREEWSTDKHTYKVTFDVTMDPSSASAPIPYYGYENGKNIRWITLEKSGNLWKIMGIGTGP